jgi:hypothetical protein
MKKAHTKISLAWSAAAAGALLCGWWGVSHRAVPAAPKGIVHKAPIHATTAQRDSVGSISSIPVREATVASQDLTSRPSIIDNELRLLEQEIRRAAQIENADERYNVLLDACARWADYDPAEAISWIRQLGLNQTSSAPIEQIIQKWAAADFPAALNWANREPAGEQRELVMERLAFVHAQNQPSAAARLVVEQIPPGPIQIEATISVLHQWALSDFSGASAWVDRFPSELQGRARAELDGIARFRLVQR